MDDTRYLEIFLQPIRQCENYLPKLGLGSERGGVSLTEFKSLYRADVFYRWLGLSSELFYSAHRAAGGITSIYRQIGISCERLLRAVIIDAADYADEKTAVWSYTAQTAEGKTKTLSLDGRIELSSIRNKKVLGNVKRWLKRYCASLDAAAIPQKGIVFEVRQGYKSKDSKRQNADIDNATVAWANNYLPVFAVFSAQIDPATVTRYKNNRCGILLGTDSDNTQESLYAFCAQILEYDIAAFFNRNSRRIKKELRHVTQTLLNQ